MTERYWITGAQIGTITALIDTGRSIKAKKLLEEVAGKQLIGNMKEPYEDYEIVIKRKAK